MMFPTLLNQSFWETNISGFTFDRWKSHPSIFDIISIHSGRDMFYKQKAGHRTAYEKTLAKCAIL